MIVGVWSVWMLRTGGKENKRAEELNYIFSLVSVQEEKIVDPLEFGLVSVFMAISYKFFIGNKGLVSWNQPQRMLEISILATKQGVMNYGFRINFGDFI